MIKIIRTCDLECILFNLQENKSGTSETNIKNICIQLFINELEFNEIDICSSLIINGNIV